MVKKGVSVDDAIKKTVREGIKAGIEEISQSENLDEGIQPSALEAEFLQEPEKEFSPEEWHLDALLENIPHSKGFYIKLYKHDDSVPPKWVFKEKITDYENWTDLEDDLRSYVAKKTQKNPYRWGSGTYKIMVFREGYRGFRKRPVEIPIDIDEIISGNKDVKGQISEVGEILRAAKDILADKKTPEDMSKTIAEVFKSGVEVMKNSMPQNKDSANISGVSNIKEIFSFLKESGFIDGKQDDIIVKLILPILQSSLQPKPDDFWDKLARLKELGVIRMGDEGTSGDVLGSVDKLTQLIELAQTISNMGIGGGEKPSVAMELVKTLAPQVPKIIENVTGAIKSYSDMKKSAIVIPSGIPSGVNPVLPMHRGASETGAPHPPLIPEKAEIFDPYANLNVNATDMPVTNIHEKPVIEEKKSMNPVMRKIYDAIESRDKDFYPELKNMLVMYIGPHILESLISGAITSGAFLQQLATMTSEPFFMEDKAKIYFNEFIISTKQEAEASQVSAKCGTCGEIYDYNSVEEFEKDSKTCDNCGGTIEIIKEETVGTA